MLKVVSLSQRQGIPAWGRPWVKICGATTTLAISALLVASCAHQPIVETGSNDVRVLGLVLNETGLPEVLLRLGAASGVYLAGEDREFPRSSIQDPVVLRYEKAFSLQQSHRSRILVELDPRSLRVRAVSVAFLGRGESLQSPVPLEEATTTFGPDFVEVRRPLVLQPGEIEGDYLDCDDPHAKERGHSLVYRRLGLEVEVGLTHEGKEVVSGLRYSNSIRQLRLPLPPCPN